MASLDDLANPTCALLCAQVLLQPAAKSVQRDLQLTDVTMTLKASLHAD